jgi:hypothetical protein
MENITLSMPIVWIASVSAWCENTPDMVIAMFVLKYSSITYCAYRNRPKGTRRLLLRLRAASRLRLEVVASG